MTETTGRFQRLRVVLVEPQYDGNLGQVARAMRNFGLFRLVLVAGDADPTADESRWFAREEGAPILDAVVRVATLGEAIADCAVVIGCSRRSGKYRGTPQTPEQIWAEARPWSAAHETALVFGREAHGLTTGELDMCHRVLSIPSDEACPSLNLAHAVAVVGYTLMAAHAADSGAAELLRDDEAEPASSEQIEGMFQHLRRVWYRIGYLNPQNPEAILRRWRRILHRGTMSVHDINVIRAMAHQTDYIAKLAKVPEGGPTEAPEMFNKHQNR